MLAVLALYVGGPGPLLGLPWAVLGSSWASVGGPGGPWVGKWPEPERGAAPDGQTRKLAACWDRSESSDGPDQCEAQYAFVQSTQTPQKLLNIT